LQIVYRKTSELIPYARNNKIHNERQIKLVAASIQEFGFKNPVIVDTNNTIIAGHGRVKAAELLKLEEVPCIIADDLTKAQIKAYRIADNKLADLGEYNVELLQLELQELQEMHFDVELLGVELETTQEDISHSTETTSEDNPYTKKIEVPLYEPKNEKPALACVYDSEKYNMLCENIKKSSVTEEEKAMLLAAAARHIVFNYELIADYYSRSTSEFKNLAEESALVIIDFEKAIRNGYVKLSESIKKQYGEEYE
jgi:hypothetical protein